MREDIDLIIINGYKTWVRNMILAVPFILSMIASMIFIFISMFIFVAIFIMPQMSATTIVDTIDSEVIMQIIRSLIQGNLFLFVAGSLVVILLLMLINTFFEAGAIGMGKVSLLKGNTTLSDMWHIAKENYFNLFFVKILTLLIFLVGFLLFIPAILLTNSSPLNQEPSLIATVSIILGLLLWIAYMLISTVFLFFTPYALVIDNLDPISALEKSINFARNHLIDTILMFILTIAISLLLQVLNHVLQFLGHFWTIIAFLISLVVVQPLTTIWITRMYMSKTDRDLYSFDLYKF